MAPVSMSALTVIRMRPAHPATYGLARIFRTIAVYAFEHAKTLGCRGVKQRLLVIAFALAALVQPFAGSEIENAGKRGLAAAGLAFELDLHI